MPKPVPHAVPATDSCASATAPPTSAEVARRAGVSRTAVSFVLNGVRDKGISEATRERVLAAALELGYAPNAAARSLAGGASNTVALVVPATLHLCHDAFLAQLVASANEACHAAGLKLLIESTEGEGREPGGFMQLVRSRRIDGLIVAHPRAAEVDHLRRLRDQQLPLVVLGRDLPDPAHDAAEVAPGSPGVPGRSPGNDLAALTIGDPTAQSAQLAVRHLQALGHRRIAFVGYAPPEFRSVNQRELGWRLALQAQGTAVQADWLAYANISAQSGWAATRELLARQGGWPGFTALFAGNDTIAFGVLRALHEAGLRVPQDVAVVGYDDIPLAAFASPPLTTVRTDPVGYARQAVQLLVAQLRGGVVGAGGGAPEAVPVAEAPHLVVRASCGAAAAG